MQPAMERFARGLLARRRRVLGAWALLCILGAMLAAGLPGRIVSGGEAPSSADSEIVSRALTRSPLPSLFLAVRVPRDFSTEQQQKAADEVAASAEDVDGVTAVAPMPNRPPVELEGSRVTVLRLSTEGGTDGAIKVAHALEKGSDSLGPSDVRVYVGGFGAYRDQLTELSQRDLEQAERIGIPIVFVVLLLTFGSFWAAGLPLVIALSALVMGMGAVGAASFFLPMSDFVTNSASMIGVALGVDYAMFLLQRVREHTRSGAPTDEAVVKAMGTTGTAVLWSGVTVLLAEATLLLVDSRSIRSAAFGMVMVTIFAVTTALVVAPVLISLFSRRVSPPRRHVTEGASTAGWRGWATHVTGRGAIWLLAGIGVMVALAVPSLGLHDNVSISGTSSLPADASVRRPTSWLRRGMDRPRSARSPCSCRPTDASHAAQAARMVESDQEVSGVATQPLPDGSVVLAVTTKHDPYSEESRELVDRLRDGDIQARLGGVEYRVGGESAASVDATTAMFDGLPKVAFACLWSAPSCCWLFARCSCL